MIEQDYIMRLIKDIVRMLAKILFHIDQDSPIVDQLEDEEVKTYEKLVAMVDQGRINEAEDLVYEQMEGYDRRPLKIALLFFDYLNDKPDEFLEAHNFSRQEVEDDLKDIISKYGLDGILE